MRCTGKPAPRVEKLDELRKRKVQLRLGNIEQRIEVTKDMLKQQERVRDFYVSVLDDNDETINKLSWRGQRPRVVRTNLETGKGGVLLKVKQSRLELPAERFWKGEAVRLGLEEEVVRKFKQLEKLAEVSFIIDRSIRGDLLH